MIGVGSGIRFAGGATPCAREAFDLYIMVETLSADSLKGIFHSFAGDQEGLKDYEFADFI